MTRGVVEGKTKNKTLPKGLIHLVIEKESITDRYIREVSPIAFGAKRTVG